jgi:phospholipid/cholesterol/gamma-HCH transport system substrate-binding protein
MYSKVNYTIVGIFVVLFTIGMVWFAFWLAKYGLQDKYKLYKVEMKESVAGLSKDSSVKLHGVDIGRVSDIRINPTNIEVIEILLKIKEGIVIKEDMRASTKMLGVTGLLSIEIDGGTNEAKTLVPTESYIPTIPTKTSLMTKLTDNLGTMSEKLDMLLSQSQKLLSDKNIDTFGTILNNVEKVTLKSEKLEDSAMVALDAFSVSMENINKKFTQATKDFKQMQVDFAEIKDVTVPTVDKLFQTSKDFRRVTLKFEKSLDRGDYNLKKMLEPMLVDIEILSNQLNTMTRELSQNPSEILFKSRKQRRGPGE